LDYPLIVDTYDIFDAGHYRCIMMEYVNGSTFLDYCNSRSRADIEMLRVIFSELVLTIEYLHGHGIIHRDLKCENIMLDANCNIRLIDFGFSKELQSENALCSTQCGSPAYMAPEIVLNQPYDFAADIRSLGVIFYAASTGSLPFPGDSVSQQLRNILHTEPVFPPDLPPLLIELISGMLRKDPTQRFNIDQIKAHPWLITDLDGHRSGIYGEFLEERIVRANPELPLDGSVLGIMDWNGDEEALRRAVVSNERTRETLQYRILRKISLTTEMAILKDHLFTPPVQILGAAGVNSSLAFLARVHSAQRRLSLGGGGVPTRRSSALNVTTTGLSRTMTGVPPMPGSGQPKVRPIAKMQLPALRPGANKSQGPSAGPLIRRTRAPSFDTTVLAKGPPLIG
jgi:serine/threonine protein kinase